jgi:hypothetical protein
MRDHDVVANLDSVHAGTSFQESFSGVEGIGRKAGAGQSAASAAGPPRAVSPELKVISQRSVAKKISIIQK